MFQSTPKQLTAYQLMSSARPRARNQCGNHQTSNFVVTVAEHQLAPFCQIANLKVKSQLFVLPSAQMANPVSGELDVPRRRANTCGMRWPTRQ